MAAGFPHSICGIESAPPDSNRGAQMKILEIVLTEHTIKGY